MGQDGGYESGAVRLPGRERAYVLSIELPGWDEDRRREVRPAYGG